MLDQSMVVIGAGPLPELLMRGACTTLAEAFGVPLSTIAVGESPQSFLADLHRDGPRLVRLAGDSGRVAVDGSCWIDALGAWRVPTLLLATPLADGAIPGVVPAYLALCQSRRVPLIGLIQIGGAWRLTERRRDGLPWSGWMADQGNEGLDALVTVLQRQLRR